MSRALSSSRSSDAQCPLPPISRDPPRSLRGQRTVAAGDRLPLRKAELVAPDGLATPATYLNVVPSPRMTLDREFATSPYAGNTFGYGNITANLVTPGGGVGAPQPRVAVLAMLSTAWIPLPVQED